MRYKVKPTKKQIKTMEIMENNRGIAVSKAMELAGYAKATAKNPKNLTKSRAYQRLAEANGVTIEQYMLNLGLAMVADKQNNFTGEITPDFTTRLSANKMAERFIGLDKPSPTELKESILDVAKDADEIQLLSAVFKKPTPTDT